MEVKELYAGLKRIQDKGEIGNAYNGCVSVMDDDNEVLDNFYEYVLEKYEDSMPLWAEVFVQIYNWQFGSLHEGECVYYENFYGDSDRGTILRTAEYLHRNGYTEIEKLYVSPMKLYLSDVPELEDSADAVPDVREEKHMEIVWRFYVDILERHREELLTD